MPSETSERTLAPTYDRKGNPEWKSTMSPPDDSIGLMCMVPDRIIPIIFVPGVMGSNLRGIGDANGTNWRLDSPMSMVRWATKDAAERKRVLTPATMVVDDNGLREKGTAQHDEELRRRGWGEVGAMSYASFLVWLENALNDYDFPKGGPRDQLIGEVLGAMKGEASLTKDEVALSYKYLFPVHACGYNWLDDNVIAAKRLKSRIDAVISRYNREKKMCEKVIVVTHSMGGLVARHCSELLGMSDKILGVVHGVMPAIGAAAVYRRFKAGTEGDLIPAMILGNNAAEMTAVLSTAPGPMQLLPTPDYGNHWLRIKDGNNVISFPKNGDPYSEIYTVRGKWWSMCDDKLINPLNMERDAVKNRARADKDWESFLKIITKQVKIFHDDIKNKYHPNTYAFFGSHQDHRAYGTVTWDGMDDSVNDLLLRGNRPADVVNARPLDGTEVTIQRNVSAVLSGTGWKKEQKQRYTISEPDEPGDGTVPHRSGIVPRESQSVKAVLQVNVGHEPAFKDSELARQFTLRSIVQIAYAVTKTSLHYE
jgi:hypothetical protein